VPVPDHPDQAFLKRLTSDAARHVVDTPSVVRLLIDLSGIAGVSETMIF